MTLLLSNEEVADLLTMPACLDAMERAYRELGENRGVNGVRSEMLTPTGRPDGLYALLTMGAVIPAFEIGAVRINSDVLTWTRTETGLRRVKVPGPDGRYCGLVLMFSSITGEPLAIFPDGVMQRMRVGAVSGLGAKYLAREDARTVGLIGTGWQAGAQAMAICAVRAIERIACYSPAPERCRRFAEEMTEALGVPVTPAASAREAVRGADVVMSATNSMQPILMADWIEPGMHVTSLKRLEMDPAVAARADVAFTHVQDAQSYTVRAAGADLARDTDAQRDRLNDATGLAKMPKLTDLLLEKAPGRRSERDITLFLNYAGLGYQFAAAGYAVLQQARARKVGRDLPSDWFTGAVPS
jgi:ornithine cyclodeaminase/alanine dehydrogenase-like protein (mu-crystallin family)